MTRSTRDARSSESSLDPRLDLGPHSAQDVRLIVLSQNLSIEAHSGRKTSQTRLLMDRRTGGLPGGALRAASESREPGPSLTRRETPRAAAVRWLQTQSGNVIRLGTKTLREGRFYAESALRTGSATQVFFVVLPDPIALGSRPPLSWVDLQSALHRDAETDADPLLSQAQHRALLQDFLADHPDPRGARQPVSASTLNRMHVADSLRFRPLRTPDELRTRDDQVIPEQEGQASRSPLETLFAAGEDLSVIPPTTFVHRGQSDRPRSFTFGLDTQPNEEEQALAMRWPDFDPAY